MKEKGFITALACMAICLGVGFFLGWTLGWDSRLSPKAISMAPCIFKVKRGDTLCYKRIDDTLYIDCYNGLSGIQKNLNLYIFK